MTDRDRARADFLIAHGWGAARRTPLAGDASFRRYVRLDDGMRHAILMDAPPPHEDVDPFVRVARALAALGLSAPAVLAAQPAAGFLLLEDLGDATFTRLLNAGSVAAEGLYGAAIDVLADLHGAPPPAALGPYDPVRLIDEALLLLDWFLPAATGTPASAAVRDRYIAAWQAVLPALDALPRAWVLRDYHVDNLIWLPGRVGVRRVGLLDFQDARAGSPAYDVISLLEDARRDVPADLATAMRARYLAARPELPRGAFATACAILGAQRGAKVIGIFTRLDRRDGKPAYRAHLPRVWRHMNRALADPVLAPVAAWMERHLPAAVRGA